MKINLIYDSEIEGDLEDYEETMSAKKEIRALRCALEEFAHLMREMCKYENNLQSSPLEQAEFIRARFYSFLADEDIRDVG